MSDEAAWLLAGTALKLFVGWALLAMAPRIGRTWVLPAVRALGRAWRDE